MASLDILAQIVHIVFTLAKGKGYCDRNEISYTRSRSYHKNDQAHIEGKNYQSVRRVTGYERITDPKLVEMIDDLYQNEHRLLTNYFYTTLKLKEKVRINGKVRKVYEEAKTPYQRLLESDKISKETKDRLKKEYERLNPAELQRSLKRKLEKIKDYRSVTVFNLATTVSMLSFGHIFKSGNTIWQLKIT